MTEDRALELLARPDLPGEEIEAMARDEVLLRSRPVLRALVAHARTPRHVSLPRARQLFTFDLMQVALAPSTPGDVRVFVEELLLKRLATLAAGERLTFAKRASTRVAAALLRDADTRVVAAALDNPHVTEAVIVAALRNAGPELVEAVCCHPKWPLRPELQAALLRHPRVPLAAAAKYISGLPLNPLRELLAYVAEPIRVQIEKELQDRKSRQG